MIDTGGNCTIIPEKVATDPGVAGAGVLLSFIITNFLSLALSAAIILLGLRKSTSAPICRKLLLSFSDQQIITGIGIQSVGLAKMKTMVPYHFFIIWMLSLLATATNLSTLLALVNDFKRDWVLRWVRQGLMFVNLLLGVVMGVFVLKSVLMDLEPRLPIGCVWEAEGRKPAGNASLSVVGTIAVIAGNVVIFVLSTWYLHYRRNPKWLKSVQVGGLGVMFAIGVGATVRVVLLSQAFGSPPTSIHLQGEGEKEWSFGQLVPLLLLMLPLVSTIEIVRGELRVVPNSVDYEEDEKRLLGADGGGELGRMPGGVAEEYQPNPLWGSQSNLFGK
jgi:hypothetical protein